MLTPIQFGLFIVAMVLLGVLLEMLRSSKERSSNDE